MPTVLVVSQHAERFKALIEAEDLPALDASYCQTTRQASSYAPAAEIIFGAPDRIVPILDDCKHLRWIQSSWAGVKPLIDQGRDDYLLTGVKDIFGPPMSEFVLAWLLALERGVLSRAVSQRWNDRPEPGVAGKTVGIMGTGSIGSHVASTCGLFGMQTRGLNTSGSGVPAFDRCFPLHQLREFASGLDYLVALLPETSGSDKLIDAALLDELKPGAILINAGRANCIVEQDLLAALASGQLRHAVLDVIPEEPLPPENPLWAVENLSITSHTSAPTRAAPIVAVFADNYRRYMNSQRLQYAIDFKRGY
jgi:phosphoglycerate dehydrogenase-like enzyme